MTLEELYQIIIDRKKNMPENSYVTSLFKDGNDRIIQKIGEEAIEVVIAAKNQNKNQIISEITDLWFHVLILLAAYNIPYKDILKTLENRNKTKQKIE